jgi:FKBP-type peptidyl-prolyl cis-trans isomerase
MKIFYNNKKIQMKTITGFVLMITALLIVTGCNKINYRKTKSGLSYKLYTGPGKDSLVKEGQIVKFNVIVKLNDSVFYSSFDKMPAYIKYTAENPTTSYSLMEILPMMNKGDSAVLVQMADTLLKRGEQLPGSGKKGDRIITSLRILEIFSTDSVGMADYNAETEKDKPRRMKEQEEQIAKMEKERNEQQIKEDIELEKSGEIAKEFQAMEAYLAEKKINAQKTGKGTYVEIKEQGSGAQAQAGKYVTVKYTGKYLATDSTFQSNSYSFQLGIGGVIRGWDEGLLLFKEGGKGILYIPGFLAYGKNPPPGSPFKPFDALKFDVELVKVSDTPLEQQR